MEGAETAATKPQAGLYRKPAPVDRDRHKDMRVQPIAHFGFAGGLQTVPVTASEFKEVQKEYPLVFARNAGGRALPAALLGLRRGENLFVQSSGQWNARYIPAFIRRYPFIFADSGANQFALCVDEQYEGLGQDVGERLFEDGNQSAYLKGIVEFMGAYQGDFQFTEQFCKRLEDLGLLTQMSAKAEMRTGQKFLVQNFMVADEAKLRNIDSVSIGRMFQSGELGLIYAHLMSLSNLARLIDLLAARGSPA